ncbi:MAG: polysaccharide deacetylase family protein [Eubacterium sp.]|nr:polysaccharide deacetylase family protein [Eubacterium sp.]
MDYLKGYDSRNSRRRSSYRRRRASSRRRKRHVRFTPFSLLKWAVPVVLVVAATFGICYIQWSGQSSDQTAHLAATAASVDASQAASSEAVKGKVADEVKAVGALSPDSIVKPTPAPKVRSKAVALTFDDGPSTVNTPKILATLKKYNAHATFFVVGTRVSSGADILKQELVQGCEIANHTWDHADLSKLPMKKVNKECDRVADLVKKLTGGDVRLLRPPYGAISDKMREKLKHPMIYWNIDTLDWKTMNAKKTFRAVKKQVSDGDIILMHDIHAPTAEAVEKIVPWLIKNDYDILTVSELMKRKGIKMKNGKVYMSAKK